MKRPLFDVIITAYGDTATGKPSYGAKVVGRYAQHDGKLIGSRQDCTLDEAIKFARGAHAAFLGDEGL